jgi:hypothetical protein
VGGLVGPTERFLVPRELLRRRSRTFRELLERHAGERSSETIQLPDTPVQTMEDFFTWTFSPQPQIDERATFSELVRLGIFAWKYQVSALSNQVTDMIRSNLANRDWQLQASMVDDIYEATPSGSPLREVIRAALGQLPRSIIEGEGQVREEWKATFLKHAQLGWDYIEAGGSEWTPQDYLLGVCHFHDHQGVSHQEELFAFCDGCPYAREDCYPRWEQESMNGLKDEEQEGCGAEKEMIGKKGELSVEAVINEVDGPVALEAVVDEVNGTVASEAVIDEVNGTATSEAGIDEVNRPVASEAVVDEMNGTVASEAVIDEVNGTATSEAGIDEVNRPVASEAVVVEMNGTVASEAVTATSEAGIDEVNRTVVSEEAIDEVNGTVASDSVVDEMDGPVAMESIGTVTEERVGETVIEKVTMEVKSLNIGGRKGKKKRAGR